MVGNKTISSIIISSLHIFKCLRNGGNEVADEESLRVSEPEDDDTGNENNQESQGKIYTFDLFLVLFLSCRCMNHCI